MANTVSQRGRAGGGRRWCAPTRADLLTFLVAAMLCSASYCLGIWHNSRGAADSRVLGPGAAASCRGGDGALAVDDADDTLDFEAHHAAEGAGLSVSASASAAAAAARGGHGAPPRLRPRAMARRGRGTRSTVRRLRAERASTATGTGSTLEPW